MIRAKDRTIDVYKRAGSEMRLLKSILSKVTVDVSKVLTATDCSASTLPQAVLLLLRLCRCRSSTKKVQTSYGMRFMTS